MKRKKTYIIAEAGVNHNGNLQVARKMVEVAAEAKADAVKFQTFKAENLALPSAPKVDYQASSTPDDESQFAMLQKLELSLENHLELLECCRRNRIDFLSTPFDLDSVDLLIELGLHTLKISSGDITDLPLLRKIGRLKKKVILSTGMSTLDEIADALNILQEAGTPLQNITVLHCNTEYPTPAEDVNLLSIRAIEEHFNVRVGYSDHTLGIEIPIAAVSLGAEVIEKHFTLDKNLPGPDHKASLEPAELKDMVIAIRNIEKAFGSALKKPSPSELKNLLVVRKSIVARQTIQKGEIFSEKNLTTLRPGNGMSPMQWDDIIGTPASRDFSIGEQVTKNKGN
ncbi:MAG: pseudaminic acid synthase [Desulfobacterales bacterium SG8_35_2]|nr:MAG: pseudaminic acid synthase [Desulfobacterales bacterium SG8_35_2]